MKFKLCVLWCCVWWTLPAHSMKKTIGLGELKAPTVIFNTREDWFTQKMDHFNPSDKRTWQQRFQLNSDYYQHGGPLFLMIGGEGAILESWMYSGTWIDYAKEFHAMCIQLEHRYYGLSHPTEDLSTNNLAYLNSEQALADIAEFITNIRKCIYTDRNVYCFPESAELITFGGSYAGSLSAWMRLKYPHLVHAAVSSSGPLLAKVDFYDYYNVVEKSLAAYSPECAVQIKQANQMLNSLLRNGAKTIEQKFRLCEPFDSRNRKNVATLFDSLASNFAEIVQYNKGNRFYTNSKRNSININSVCDIMVDESILTPLDRYAEVNSLLLNAYEESCLNVNYTKMLSDYYLNTSLDNASFGVRSWTYQTCTEFGFYQTSSQDNHTFSAHFPVEFFIDMCTDIFGKSFEWNLDLAKAAVERTNMMYGGLDIKESRVVYVHGNVDPWHALGVTDTRNNTILINGTSHCADMYPPDESDPKQLTDAREQIKEHLKQWLMENDNVKSL